MSVAAIIPSMLPLLIVAMMRRAENRIYRQLSDANAYTPDSAIALSPGRSIEQKRLQSLIRGGAVRLNANSQYFLDTDSWSTYRSNRRRRALLAITIILALAGMAIALLLALR